MIVSILEVTYLCHFWRKLVWSGGSSSDSNGRASSRDSEGRLNGIQTEIPININQKFKREKGNGTRSRSLEK